MHQRISKKILIYLFVFFTLVTINNTKISNDFYKIKKFNISGLNKIETTKIYDDLIIFKNNNIFSFSKANISEKIYSNNFVEKFKIFKGGMNVIDIGAAPGSWSQYASKVVKNGKIISIDLKEMQKIQNTIQIKGDFTSLEIQKKIKSTKSIEA